MTAKAPKKSEMGDKRRLKVPRIGLHINASVYFQLKDAIDRGSDWYAGVKTADQRAGLFLFFHLFFFFFFMKGNGTHTRPRRANHPRVCHVWGAGGVEGCGGEGGPGYSRIQRRLRANKN